MKTYGEVSEWFKELVLKTSDTERYRGFESHLLRIIYLNRKSLVCTSFEEQNHDRAECDQRRPPPENQHRALHGVSDAQHAVRSSTY